MLNKKGVSDVVTIVLTVMITIAAIAIIWVAITPMIKERIETSSSCYDVNIAIEDAGYTCYDKTNNISLVQVKRGSSNENITSYKFIVTSEGNSYSYQKDEKLEPNSALIFSLNTTGINSIDRISVIPVVTDGKTEKDCSVVFIDNVKSCALNQQEIEELTILQQDERAGSGGGNNNPPIEDPPIGTWSPQIDNLNFTQAIEYCENLGIGWKLPSTEEFSEYCYDEEFEYMLFYWTNKSYNPDSIVSARCNPYYSEGTINPDNTEIKTRCISIN